VQVEQLTLQALQDASEDSYVASAGAAFADAGCAFGRCQNRGLQFWKEDANGVRT